MKRPQKYDEISTHILTHLSKVNSVQEACAKCFAVQVHIKIWSLSNHIKKWKKEHQTLSFQFSINKSSILVFLFCFFMCCARFQILICKPQSIYCKLLLLSWFLKKLPSLISDISHFRTKSFFWKPEKDTHVLENVFLPCTCVDATRVHKVAFW